MEYTKELQQERNLLGREFFLIHYCTLKQERIDIGHIEFIKKYNLKSITAYKIYGSYKKKTNTQLLLQKIKNGYNIIDEIQKYGRKIVATSNKVSVQTINNIIWDRKYIYLYKK